MRIRYDKALLRLSEYSVKAHRWQITAFEQVAKDIARADGGQLRRISDKDKFRFQRKSFEQNSERSIIELSSAMTASY